MKKDYSKYLLLGLLLVVRDGKAAIQVCGNGVIEGTETCDDGNKVNNDG